MVLVWMWVIMHRGNKLNLHEKGTDGSAQGSFPRKVVFKTLSMGRDAMSMFFLSRPWTTPPRGSGQGCARCRTRTPGRRSASQTESEQDMCGTGLKGSTDSVPQLGGDRGITH